MGVVAQATGLLQSILAGETGLAWALSDELSNPFYGLRGPEIRAENVSIEVSEKSPVRYPAVLVYPDRLANTQREKFSVLSGTLSLVVEVRTSGNGIAAVSEQTTSCVEAVMKVLDCHKGEWTAGIQYCGGYEVNFQQIKRGGTQLLQISRITVPLTICQR